MPATPGAETTPLSLVSHSPSASATSPGRQSRARVDRRIAVDRVRGGPDHAVPIAAMSFVPLVHLSRLLPRAGQGEMTYSSSLCLDDAARRLRRRERALTYRLRHSDALTYGPRHGDALVTAPGRRTVHSRRSRGGLLWLL